MMKSLASGRHAKSSAVERRAYREMIKTFAAGLLILAGGFAFVGAAGAEEVLRLDLDELLALGMERNLELKGHRAGIEASTWETRSSYLAFLPTGSFTSSVTRVDENAFDQANQIQQNLPPDWEVDPFLYKNTYRSSFALNQEFPLNLHLIAGSKLARAGERAARQGFDAEKDALILELKQNYFNLLAARELVVVAEETLASAENRNLLAKDREELGMINRAERLQWEVVAAERRSNLRSAQTAAQLGEMALNRLLDQDLNTPLELAPIDEGTLAQARELSEKDPKTLTRLLVEGSPSVAVLRASNEAASAAKMLALSGLVPSVHFSFSYGWRENDTAALDDYETWSATALMQVPVLDLLGNTARYRKAAAEKRMSDYETESAIKEIQVAVNAAWHEVAHGRENLVHRETAERQAQESFSLMEDRYHLGHISEFDLADVQTELTAAKAMAVIARYDYYIALATLESLVGFND